MAFPRIPATVIITTKNRKDDLRRAVRSAVAQTAPVEVLVVDDGSTDGTSEMVRREFPSVRLHREERSRGYIVQRNLAVEMASAPIVFCIDDDAQYISPKTVEQTLAGFDDPRIGAVAIPFVDVLYGPEVRQQAPQPADAYVTASYVGAAHAVRRDLFLGLGGYRTVLFHQGEEEDYCIRLLAEGYVVRLGSADPIHHYASPKRDTRRMHVYGRRNNVLYAWQNVPLPELLVHLAGTTVRGLRHGLRIGAPWSNAWGLLRGYGACLHELTRRRPVPRSVYRLSRRLRASGCLPLSQIRSQLPSLPASPRVAESAVPWRWSIHFNR